jgi:hypothetical protein
MSKNRLVRICGQPDLSGCGNPSALPLIDRFSGFGKAGPCLDLGEHEEMTAPGDDIDLAQGTSPASCQNTEAFRDQERRRPAFSRNSHAECCLSLRPWGGPERTWPIVIRRHRLHSVRGQGRADTPRAVGVR